jgi:hypothetical protein
MKVENYATRNEQPQVGDVITIYHMTSLIYFINIYHMAFGYQKYTKLLCNHRYG